MKAFIELLLPVKFRDSIGKHEGDWIIQTSTGDYRIVDMDEDLYDDWRRGRTGSLLFKIEIDVDFKDLSYRVSVSDLEYMFNCPDLEGCYKDIDFENSNPELVSFINTIYSLVKKRCHTQRGNHD